MKKAAGDARDDGDGAFESRIRQMTIHHRTLYVLFVKADQLDEPDDPLLYSKPPTPLTATALQ